MFGLRCLLKIRLNVDIKSQVRYHARYTRGLHLYIKKHLLFINSLTSGLCMFIGDIAQQEFEYQASVKHFRYDWTRSARMFTVGALIAPWHHFYYIYLDKILPTVNVKTVLLKILCDQTFASPATLICFYYFMGLLENKSLEECTSEFKEKFLYTYFGDCLYWPPIQFFNFYFLPTHYRVIYINIATMIFNVFLSYMKHFDQN